MSDAPAIVDLYRLTALQRGMLFRTLLHPAAGDYLTQLAVALEGPLDPPRLRAAWELLLARHGALRSAFVWEGVAEPVQAVLASARLPWEELDWSADAPATQALRLDAWLAADRARPYDLARAPLLRVALARLGGGRWQLLWSAHHLLFDGWSLPVLWSDLWAGYDALARGERAALPPPRPFRDHLAWLAAQDAAAARAFWKEALDGAPLGARLPFLAPAAAAAPDGAPRAWGEREETLDAALSARLRAAAREAGATLGTLACAAWGLLLARLSGEREVVLGTTRSGRPAALAGVEAMVGMFINTVPLRVAPDEGARVRDWLAALQARAGALAEHEWLPLHDVLAAAGRPGEADAFEALVVVESYPLSAVAADGALRAGETLAVRAVRDVERTELPLNLVVTPGERVHVRLAFDAARCAPALADELVASLRAVLEEIARDLDAPVAALRALAPSQRERLAAWSDGGAPAAPFASVAALFEARARAAPEAIACEDARERLSAAELARRAAALARALRARGVRRGAVVGVLLEPGCPLAVALFAATRAGAAWLLLDPELPAERLRLLVRDARPAALVADPARAVALGLAAEVPCVPPDAGERAPLAADAPEHDAPVPLGPEDQAYLVYTSGSTGVPKAVAVPQRAIASLVAATARDAALGPGARVAQLAALSFDVAALEIQAALLGGATLCFLDARERVPGPALEAALERARADTLFLAPSVLRELDPARLPGVRTLVVGGESLTRDLRARWGGRRIVHAYGPAEATMTAVQALVEEGAARAGGAAALPIGRPLPGVRAWVVDGALRPLPPGAAGELLIGGLGVAHGYRASARQTAERFVPDPFGPPGARAYRSGDRVRWAPDGAGASLVFLGRTDRQAKVRGVRVEPGEVEAAALAHPLVRQAAALVLPGPDGASAELVLWYAGAALAPRELRRFLAGRLPLALVPSRLEPRAGLPLAASGKADREALAREPRPERAAGEPPRGALERTIADAFAAVLAPAREGGAPPIGRDDDFFALGGHSLRALQLVARLRDALGQELALRQVYEHPSVAELARLLGGAQAAEASGGASPAADGEAADATSRATAPALPPLRPRTRAEGERVPLSLAQRRLWFLDRFDPGSALYAVPVALRLAGPLDAAAAGALERALARLVARHEVLRCALAAEDAEPWQTPRADARLRLERRALDRGESLLPALERLARAPFDLAAPPLVRATLVSASALEHVLLLVFHHVAADGWSLGILMDELGPLYDEERGGAPAALAPAELTYLDHALWQRSPAVQEALERDVARWVAALAPPPPALELPERRRRAPLQTSAGFTLAARVPAALRARVEALAGEHGVSAFMALFAAFGAWLGKLAGRDDFLVGTPVAGRERAALEPLVGLFVNTLPLRVRLAGDPDYAALLARAREEVLDAQARALAPFERLVEELVPERDLSRPPLVQVLFALQNFRLRPPRLAGLAVEPLALDTATAKFDLSLFVDEEQGGWSLALELNEDLFEPDTGRAWLASFVHVLGCLAGEPRLRLSRVSLAAPAERALLLERWGVGPWSHPRGETIASRFLDAARRHAARPALVFDGTTLTYAELERAASRLAHELRACGVGAETRVAVGCERSLELVIAVVAIVLAGGAYVPLDPLYPLERRRRMLASSGARVLVTQRSLAGALAVERELCLDDPAVRARLAARPDRPPEVAIRPDRLAYLVFTSGSTGAPKGVGVEHRAVVRLLCGEPPAPLGPDDAVLQFTSTAFDVAVWEIWGTLLAGARLELYRPETPSLAELGRFVRTRGVTTMWLTSGLFHQMVDEQPADLAGVRQLLAGGEALSPPHVARALERLPRTRLINGYGPTEVSCFTSTYPFPPDADLSRVLAVPIGRPTNGCRAYVLDRDLRPLPRGAWGALYAAGDALARGYLNDARLTAARFLPDPYAPPGALGARMYEVGDRVRWIADGLLEFGGRLDRQVKVRGFRLELGEVEATLAAHPRVRTCVVELRGAGEAKHLVAWVVPEGAPPASEELRAWLRGRLAEQMVPGRFVTLEALPLTPNGKLDRRALPEPADAHGERGAPPRGPLEELLAGVWREVLALEGTPSREDDFFGLGGHSLLATQLVVRVRQATGVELSLQTVFRHPRLAAQAEAVAAARGGLAPPAPPRHEERTEAPLSFAQERLWFLERLAPGDAAHHTPFAVELDGPLDAERLEGALAASIERHAVLRTSFPEMGGRPVQRIAPPAAAAAFRLEREDLSALDGAARAARLAAIERDVAHAPFDLERGPLLRGRLVRLAHERHALFLCLHHLVCDGWSLAVLARELGRAYEALGRGEEPERAEPPLTYADWAVWQRERLDPERRARELAWWRDALAGSPARLELGPRRPAASGPRRVGGVEIVLPRPLVEALEERGRALGATPFMVHLVCLQALLGRLSGRDDFVVGAPVAGRLASGVDGLLGPFVNLVALRAELGGEPSFAALVERVRATTLSAFEHQELPVEELADLLRAERRGARDAALFGVLFTLHNTPGAELAIEGLVARRRALALEAAFADVWLSLEPPAPEAHAQGVGLRAYVHHDLDVLDEAAARRFVEGWRALLAALARDPALVPARVALWSEDEERRFAALGRAPARHPTGATIDGAFAAQAARRPDAVALAWEDGAWTYGELERRANRLARFLRERGVGSETRVALALERSGELVLAELAVLRAGGAYVPLADDLPPARRAALLASSGAALVLTTARIADELPAGSCWPIALDLEREAIERTSDAPLAPLSAPDRLAYVMHTSGTTGAPKAVGVEHASVLRLVLGARFLRFGAGEVWLQYAPAAFDAATLEVWGALLNGARLEVFRAGPASLAELARFVERRGVTSAWLTAALFHQMVEEEAPRLRGLRQLVAGGDELAPASVARALAALPGCRVVNGYGPTECTTFSAAHTLAPGEDLAHGVPLGGPIEATALRVLDAALRPLPPGFWGELFVSGRGVARGYLNDPRASAARFLPDPWSEAPGARMYRTGDRARWNARGLLEFGGRLDRQLKLRGFRVEPAEVEAALCAHPALAAAAVEARGEGEARRLVAWVVPRGAPPAPGELHAHLARALPAAWIPARFATLDALPVTPNGKLDRRALVEPADDAPAAVTPAAGDARAELLAALAAEVLGLERVGPADDFFERGGHSLSATRLVARVREAFGVELPLAAVFEHPRLDALARAIEARRAGGAAPLAGPARASRDAADHPLTFAQERLWLLEELAPGSATYHVPFALTLEGALDADALGRAWDVLRERHEALRTRLFTGPNGPRQAPRPAAELARTRLVALDLSALAPDAAEARLAERAHAAARAAFDLAAGEAARLELVRLAPERHVLLLVLHHVACDAWSLAVLARELGLVYAALARGAAPELPPLALRQSDLARWQRSPAMAERVAADVAWWRAHLAGAPERLVLGTRVRRTVPRARPAGLLHARLDPALAAALEARARAEGATLFLGLLALYQTLVASLSGERDFLVGTPSAGRGHAGLEPLVGFLVGTLALRADLGGRPSFRALLARVRREALDAWAHEEAPFEEVAPALGGAREQGGHAHLQLLFALQNAPRAALELAGLRVAARAVETGAAHAEVFLSLEREPSGALAAAWEYDAELFDAEQVAQWHERFEALARAFVRDPEADALGALAPAGAERERWLARGRGRDGTFPADRDLWSLFEDTLAASDAPAVVSGARTLSRAALRDDALALARRLARAGVRPGARVGLRVREAEGIALGALGILRAGAAYVPLDPDLPSARASALLAAADARALVCDAADALALACLGPRCVPLRADDAHAPAALPARLDAGAPAYVMFTSGSTGVPKGVIVPQRAVARLVVGADYVRLGPRARVARAASQGFDALTFELFGALLCGGTLVEAGRERTLSAPALRALVAAERLTHLLLTTAVFEELVRQDARAFEGLEEVLFGGERMAPALVRRLLAGGAPPARLVHVYGPTEATTFATTAAILLGDCGDEAVEPLQVPIGWPIQGTDVLVLDEALVPVPDGAPGELCVAGPGLADGYLGRPARTAASFVPHPFPRVPGERVYRTGDLVRRDPRGRLVFLGRRDAQLKLRGLRIEPGEVEAALGLHPLVRAAHVDARGEGGERFLAAWVVPRASDAPPEPRALRAWLAARLPRQMVPASFALLDELPVSRNGKIDRAALPAPPPPALAQGAEAALARRAAPDPLRELVVAVVAGVLGRDAVALDAGFFEQGGHSLSAARVAARLAQALGREVPLRALFEAPTLDAFAERLARAGAAGTLAGPETQRQPGVPREGPLSFAQERLWFLERLRPGSALYHVPIALRLSGALDEAALRVSLAALVRRHEALRTRLVARGALARQVVDAPGPLALATLDLSALAPDDAQREERAALERAAREPFDLEREPGWRALLVRRAERQHVLCLVVHHALCDGRSLGILVGELGALYAEARGGGSALRERLAAEALVQPIDHARWQRAALEGAAGEARVAWWRERLAGAPDLLPLRTDRPRPRVQSLRGASVPLALAPALTAALDAFARAEAATPFAVLHAALAALLARWSGADDLCVGTPAAGRGRPELEPTFGFLVDTLVLRTRVAPDATLRALVRRCRGVLLDAFEHRDVPFERVVEALALPRDASRNPLFQVMLALQDDLVAPLALPDLALEPLPLATGTAKFDLTVALAHERDAQGRARLAGEVEYDAALFERATVERLVAHLRALLERALAQPDRPLAALALQDEHEEARLAGFARGRAPRAEAFEAVHERFLRQAARAPDAPAVADARGAWSYGELERRSRGLAAVLSRALSEEGTGAEPVVALAARRSKELVLGALGALRAGAAYLPLDVDHPPARLAGMLADARVRIALVDADGARALAGSGVRALALDAGGERDPGACTPPPAPHPDALAYVVYTSGSTGRPKGVAVPQRGLANLAAWHLRAWALGPDDRSALVAGTAFDASVWELWPALCAGACLCVPPEDVRAEPARLARWLAEERIGVTFLPTPLAEALLDLPQARALALRTLLTGGDRLRKRPDPALGLALVNCYGPSEASVVATAGAVAPRAADGAQPAPSIGRPIDGVVARVLDAALAPAAIGVPGELCVGGAGVARGYVGNSRATAERFVPDPLGETPGARLYRTGDRALWLADGRLAFLGRGDDQVQVRGLRVEPAEIEAALLRQDDVLEAAVLALEEADGPRLAAWVVAAPGRTLALDLLRERMSGLLPAAMVPSAWCALERLPKNASGKIDRAALPRPARAGELAPFAPPRGPLEERLAALWAAVLGLERVSRDASFFALGGHSLALLELQARLARELGREVAVVELFAHPSVADLARFLEPERVHELAPAPPREAGERARGAERGKLRREGRARRAPAREEEGA